VGDEVDEPRVKSRHSVEPVFGNIKRRWDFLTSSSPVRQDKKMTTWEYLIVALPRFEPPTSGRESSAAVQVLNAEGSQGWEAIGMTVLDDGTVAVLLKKPRGD
jgi:hypothetical protein